MTKRVILIVGVFLICIAGTYFFLKPNPETKTRQALDHLLQNNVAIAEATLNSLSSQPMTFPLALYQGYLAQARGRYQDADLFLQLALNEPLKNQREEILVEIFLAQTSNAYLEMRDHELSPLLERAKKISSDNAFILFFEGLVNYLHEQYAEALRSWNAFSPEESTGGSGWMPSLIERLFPISWRQIHVAHCLTEEGDILRGREILEKEGHHVRSQDGELHNLATLFLGLTYLKESGEIPLTQRGSYYKLARFYFERAGQDLCFARERCRIITHVQKEAETLLLADLNEQQQKWGFDFVHILQEWKAETAVEMLADRLAQKMLRQKGPEIVTLCQSIRQEFHGTPFHLILTQKLLSAIAHGLQEGETENLFDYWAMIESLSSTPKLAAKEIASLTSKEIFSTIKRDGKSLFRTRNHLAFWEKLEHSEQEQEQLAHNLLCHAKVLWQNGGQEKKGERLMELALNYSSPLQNEIETFLTDLYSQAENSNLIGRMALIYDAMEHFQIEKQELASASKLANHLADAEYLYDAHNYTLAKTHAAWVLKLEPQNQQALRLVGLSSFHLGEYYKAHSNLKELANPDEHARKALMLSQVFSSQEQDKHLAQIDNTDSFDEDE